MGQVAAEEGGLSHAYPAEPVGRIGRIPNPRNRRGTRHPLSAILGLTVLAMLTDCKSYTAIA